MKRRSKQITKAELLRQNASLLERLNEAEKSLRAVRAGELDGLVLSLLGRLEETEETLRALRAGEVDALVVDGNQGQEVLTLQKADQSYRTIFETMNEGVAVVGREGAILHCNPRLGTLLKQPVENLLGANILQYVGEADRPSFERLLLGGGNGNSNPEMAFRCADGSSVFVQLALNAVDLHGAQATCVVAAEITDLKRSEERLQKSEERFRLLIEDVRDYAILALDEKGNVESWNRGAERVKGYRAEEILGRHCSCCYDPKEIQEGIPERALVTAREQGRFEHEGWLVRKDGSRFWAHVATTALRGKDGRLIGFSEVIRDNTRQKEAEKALRQSEELFHSAVDYFPGGFAIYDAQKRFQFVNLFVRNLSGLTEGQFLGHANEELFAPEITSRYLPALERCAKERTAQTFELALPARNEVFVFLASFVPILDERGELQQILGIGYDITARRRAEEQVEASLKTEVILRREIQHRVKNSIQIISSLLFLQSRELTDPKMIEVLRECQSRARSIALVYGMLSQRPEIAGIDFGSYAQELIGALSTAYELKRDVVAFEILPQKTLLDLDTAVPCGLILTELVSNALKYAFPDSKAGRIVIDLQPEGESDLVLTVSDNGIGLPHGFDAANSPSLGLRLVRDLSEQLGGHLDFRSAQGTTVEVRFPARRS